MNDQRSTISSGFQVEFPSVFLSWGTPLTEVSDTLASGVVSFQDAIVQASGVALNGLECSMLMHGPRGYGTARMDQKLTMISFSKRGTFRETFDEIQLHLEQTFGPPDQTMPGDGDWPGEFLWLLGDVVIGHYADDKGGPQARASIRKSF